MSKKELVAMFIFNMKQRMNEHVVLEEVEESLEDNTKTNTLYYQIAKIPFDIDTIFGSGEISDVDLSLRLFIRSCVLKQDLASLYEKYIQIFSTNDKTALFLIEAGIACITLKTLHKFTCVLYSAVVYTPKYGESVESLTEFLEQMKFDYIGD